MRLGVAFSVFSGAEFLKPALLNVREFAYHIVLIYSTQSNEGHPAPPWLVPLLQSLLKEGLADELVEHKIEALSQVPIQMQTIQRVKRQMGRLSCLNAGCTHYATRDCDEFYDKDQFRLALKEAESTHLLICGIYDYIRSPLIRSRQISPLHVPVIHNSWLVMTPRDYYGVLLDHERTCDAGNWKVLPNDQLMMHHMTAVRFNDVEIRRKFQGHSHFMRLGPERVEGYMDMIHTFDSSKAESVPDMFGIVKYWEEEFGRIYENIS